MSEPGPVGVRVNGGKLHVRRPGARPVTRCGQPLRQRVTEHPADGVPADDRCRNCFPASARATDDDPRPTRIPGSEITAQHDGRCAADCGRYIHPGDVIAEAHDIDGWCHAECTATTEETQ